MPRYFGNGCRTRKLPRRREQLSHRYTNLSTTLNNLGRITLTQVLLGKRRSGGELGYPLGRDRVVANCLTVGTATPRFADSYRSARSKKGNG